MAALWISQLIIASMSSHYHLCSLFETIMLTPARLLQYQSVHSRQ